MKQVTKTVTSRTVTSSGGEQSSRSSRAASPSRLARIDEKDQLVKLNDRLAAYIDHIRSLESENERLSTQVQTYEETTQRERAKYTNLYEDELAAARKLLDEMGRDNAKLSVDVGTYKAEAEEWMRKYSTKDRELSQLQRKFNDLEKLLPDLESKLTSANKEKERWQLDYGNLKCELRELERQLASARKQLEEETLLKVDLENKVQSLKEELSFKSQLHQSELNETRTRMEISVEEVDSRTQREVESRLQEALNEFRAQHEHEMRLYREEITSLYESKIRGLQKDLDSQDGLDEKARIEINVYKSRNSELQSQIAKLANQNATLEARIASLEADLVAERDQSKALYDASQQELRRLRVRLDDQLREYQDLLDVKVSLDLEISAYRKLLEGEEERLNISGSELKATPKKRRRDDAAASFVQETEASSGYNSSCRSTGALQVVDVSEKGEFVQLRNESNQEAILKGFKIVHKAGDEETDYKFHRATKLPAGETLSVWSMNAGQAADTANHLYVMKGRWVTGDSMVTALLDKDGNEVAVCEMSKSVQRTTLKARRSEEAFHQRGDPAGKQNCAIM